MAQRDENALSRTFPERVESAWNGGGPARRAGRAAVLLLLAGLFFLAILRPAWRQIETDFPNYYTAALALRNRASLPELYDWTWFAREMNRAGFGLRIGAYTPQTPLTMLPFVPLTYFAPLTAKRVWILLNCGFLGASLWLLSRVTRFRASHLALLAACGWDAWRANFAYGQYYVFLLFLLILLYVFRARPGAAGALAGLGFALKLYTAPYLLWFAARGKWRAAGTMAATVFAACFLAVALYGARGTAYYLREVAPRSLATGSINPYHPGNSTVSTLLARSFLPEPELNPAPVLPAPGLFFFLSPLVTLILLGWLALGARRARDEKRSFACFTIALLLLSTSVGSYSYVLLFLPAVLWLDDASPGEGALVVLLFSLAAAPNLARLAFLFPRVWIVAFALLVAGRSCFGAMGRAASLGLGAAAVAGAVVAAAAGYRSYRQGADQRFEPVKVEPGAAFSSSPAVTRFGLFYQAMGPDRYVLRRLRDGRIETLAFDGHAFGPRARTPDGPVDFELVRNGISLPMELDPLTGRAEPRGGPENPPARTASPDGRWRVATAGPGPRRIWLEHSDGSEGRWLTGGACSSWDPEWELDSRSIVFASDCGRAVGLPTLRRARLP